MTVSGSGARSAPAALRRSMTIRNQRGLHARAAARFVKCAELFDAEVTVAKKDVVVSGLSIMGLMMLAAGPGTTIEVAASGAEAEPALDALEALVDTKFDEE
jgi:phosphocarrier protein HPr